MSSNAGFDGGPLPLDEPVPQASFSALLESRGLQPEWVVDGAVDALGIPEATTVPFSRSATATEW